MKEFSYYRFSKSELPQNEIITLFSQTFTDSEGEAEGQMLAKLVTELLATTPEQELKIFAVQQQQQLVGCVFFTPLKFSSGELGMLLSPMAIMTSLQGQGLGQTLISFALQSLKADGVPLVFTYGDPRFYSKVGFEQITEAQYQPPYQLSYPHGWLAQSLTEQSLSAIAGSSSCVAGFNDPSVW